MTDFREFLKTNVLLLDGAMGTQIQAVDFDVEKDYWGKENCSEVLNLSRPDFVREVHRKYFAAGSDAVETNTFGASEVTLAEFDLADQCEEINIKACELAREAAEEFSDGRPRFVIGSIGPGTKLPSLGHIDYDPLETGLVPQARGLIKGAKAGAWCVSPFIGRLDDISSNGMELIRQIITIYKNYDFKTYVLVASVRHPQHVVEAALAGGHICTMPFTIFQQMVKHPLTDIGLKKFLADWDAQNKK